MRCVSMPSWDLFEAQPQSYRDEVLPPQVTARLAVELGVAPGLGPLRRATRGDMLGIDRFGASAPAEVLLEKYGFTVDNVVARRPRKISPVSGLGCGRQEGSFGSAFVPDSTPPWPDAPSCAASR